VQPEAKIVRRIQKLIREKGGRSFKIHGGDNPFQEVGIPDLLVCYKGYFLGLEVGQPGKRARPMQSKVLREIEAAGGTAAVVTTVKEVRRLLAAIERKGVM
jgi:hypothetical protein